MAEASERLVEIPVDGTSLEGVLAVPALATGVVLFAHGSGSSRHSPRNHYVAGHLRAGRPGDPADRPAHSRGGRRLPDPVRHPTAHRAAVGGHGLGPADDASSGTLPIGYFGASTGAAAALQAAAVMGDGVGAVVSRGGRPDLAGTRALSVVKAPTLLLVGGFDDVVLDLNRDAYSVLRCTKELVVVPGATHLFEEPGTLDQVARRAADWFSHHLGE